MPGTTENRLFKFAGLRADPCRSIVILRRFCSPLFDLESVCDQDHFHFDGWALHMGQVLLLDWGSNALLVNRTSTHVARGSIDHYQISMPVRGACHIEHTRGAVMVETGDIIISDMTQPSRTRLIEAAGQRPSELLTMVIPRSLLAARLRNPDDVQGSVIRGGTAYGRLVADQFRLLRDQAPSMTTVDSEIATTSMISLVAGAIGHAVADGSATNVGRQAMLQRIKRYIAGHLDSSDLTAKAMCRRFGVSRAALYRLFEPDGGLANFVQQHRLHCAFGMLTSATWCHWRIADIGRNCHYGSDATFIRAFRNLFGATPGEVRTFAESGGWPIRRSVAGRTVSSGPLLQWLEELAYGAG